jgi:hypothetical protein
MSGYFVIEATVPGLFFYKGFWLLIDLIIDSVSTLSIQIF